jgi:regulatory protein YycH of two-component signal transduction system YycFG
MTDIKSLLIGALLVAVLVLGYLFWERQRNTVEIRLPSVTIEKR